MKDLHDNYGSIEIMYQLDAICLDVSDVPIHFVGGQLELTNGEFFWSREQNGPTVQCSAVQYRQEYISHAVTFLLFRTS